MLKAAWKTWVFEMLLKRGKGLRIMSNVVCGIPDRCCRDMESKKAKSKLHLRNTEKISRIEKPG